MYKYPKAVCKVSSKTTLGAFFIDLYIASFFLLPINMYILQLGNLPSYQIIALYQITVKKLDERNLPIFVDY